MPMAVISAASFSPRAASPGELFSMPARRLRQLQPPSPSGSAPGCDGACLRAEACSNTERNSWSVAVGVRRRRRRSVGGSSSSSSNTAIGSVSGCTGGDGGAAGRDRLTGAWVGAARAAMVEALEAVTAPAASLSIS